MISRDNYRSSERVGYFRIVIRQGVSRWRTLESTSHSRDSAASVWPADRYLLAQRDKLNVDIHLILDHSTDAWGIKVSNVEIKHVDLNESMVRAIARQAEAERERRAKIIHAEGEKQAAAQLVEAAAMLAAEPKALQLRYLQTLADISSEKTTTIVFPLPMDLLRPFISDKS